MTEPAGDLREGEVPFADVPSSAGDASLRFVGLVRSAWTERADCPKNLRDARLRGGGSGVVEIAAAYRPALCDLADGQWIILLTWLDRARRDLALQRPRHANGPRGTFSLRSPARPNPIGLHTVCILALDRAAGRIALDAIDVLDGTPLIDVKPFVASVDVPPDGGAR